MRLVAREDAQTPCIKPVDFSSRSKVEIDRPIRQLDCAPGAVFEVANSAIQLTNLRYIERYPVHIALGTWNA